MPNMRTFLWNTLSWTMKAILRPEPSGGSTPDLSWHLVFWNPLALCCHVLWQPAVFVLHKELALARRCAPQQGDTEFTWLSVPGEKGSNIFIHSFCGGLFPCLGKSARAQGKVIRCSCNAGG